MNTLRARWLRMSAVVDRDWKKFRRNPIVLGMSVLMPIVYLMILGNSFQGKLVGLPLALVNEDPGPYARALVDNLRAIQAGPKTLIIHAVPDEQSAVEGVRTSVYKAALIIPAGFSAKIITRARPEVGFFVDNTDAISAQTLTGVVRGALSAIGEDFEPNRERADQTHFRNVDLYRQVDYFQSLVPGVVIMAIFLGAMTTGVFNVVMDRFLGVQEAYLLTPLTKADIVTGLVISGLSVTSSVAVLVLGISLAITRIPLSYGLGQYALILLLIVLTTLSLLSLMFTILGRAGHPRIVGVLSGFMNVILFFPSGAIYPLASLPGWLQWAARINPEAYAVEGLKAVLFKGSGFATVWPDVAYLAGFTLVMMMIATLTFKRTL